MVCGTTSGDSTIWRVRFHVDKYPNLRKKFIDNFFQKSLRGKDRELFWKGTRHPRRERVCRCSSLEKYVNDRYIFISVLPSPRSRQFSNKLASLPVSLCWSSPRSRHISNKLASLPVSLCWSSVCPLHSTLQTNNKMICTSVHRPPLQARTRCSCVRAPLLRTYLLSLLFYEYQYQ